MSDYIPISCLFYDLLEAAATKRTVCEIVYGTSNGIDEIQGRIVDLYSKSDVEYLRLDNGVEIRLDALVCFNGQRFGGQA